MATDEILTNMISLKHELLSFQTSYSEILTEKGNLEKKLIELENWNTTKIDYTMNEVTPGFFAYVSNKSQNTGKTKPWFCTKCFNDKKLSPFQKVFDDGKKYICFVIYCNICAKIRQTINMSIKKEQGYHRDF